MTLAPFSFGPTTPVAFGVDRSKKLARDIGNLGAGDKPVLLVADPALGALADDIAGQLAAAGLRVGRFSDIRSDPLGSQVDAAVAAARSLGAGTVVGLGGGSTLDVAKFAAAIAPAGEPADHYQLAVNPLPAVGLKKICLPTTAGTGSETTRVSVYTNATGEKVWAWGDALRADLALLDPRLTVGLPRHLTAATGVDALVHAIEACTIRRANLLNDAIGLQAIRLIAGSLQRAVEVPDDLDARGKVQIAAAAAGIAIDNAGTGIAHAMGHALGAIGHVHHGRAVGLCLRAALDWNAEADPVRHAAVAVALGVPGEGRDAAAIARDLPAAYDRFLRAVGLPIALDRDGLSAADAGRLAAVTMAPENKAMRDSNIREITPADAERIAGLVLSAA
ncbi:MAG: iron-containing alcohol dehydrogenase [Dongiaceae bacterium]